MEGAIENQKCGMTGREKSKYAENCPWQGLE
jgi:hypothetical protein